MKGDLNLRTGFDTLEGNMGVVELLSAEKISALVERTGWSRAYAEGYIAGETMRRRGQPLQDYVMVGMDEWAQGARAGYFEREKSDSSQASVAVVPGAPQERSGSS